MKIFNPSSERVLTEVVEDAAPAVADKFRRARAAQPAWAQRPLSGRIECLKKFRALLIENKEDLARTLTAEVGKPITQARNEIDGVLPRIDFFAEATPKILPAEAVGSSEGSFEERITLEPLGVVANISAWNYPYFVGSNVFIPALLTGNAVLYKPSEFATLSGLEIARLLHESGVPQDVFAPLVGGPETGTTLLQQEVDGVFFTGSYATGRRIAEAMGPRMIHVQLELGGKDPVYVCEDVDVAKAAASTADGAFYNNGQSCCSVERLYVHASIYEAFVERFVQEVRAFAVGDPEKESTYIGPLARGAQLAFLEKQVANARAHGARILCGGQRLERPGHYFAPTVFADVSHKMDLMREESFGPLIGIQRVGSDDEAVQLMNDTAYGLTAGVYSKDRERAQRILSRLKAGSVYYNCCDRVSPRLPWSGRGHSGIGTTLSHYGIQAMLRPKAWHLRR